jgi:signal transduction histidine kinase
LTIRLRLGLWYATICGVALLGLGLTVYLFMARHLERMVDETLEVGTAHVVDMVTMGGSGMMPGAAAGLPATHIAGSAEVFAEVLDPAGVVLARSDNLRDRTLPDSPEGLQAGQFAGTLDELTLKVRSTPVQVDGQTVAWVRVGTSYEFRDAVLLPLGWVLLGGGAGAVVTAGFLGAGLAGRALAPMRNLADTARAIALSRGFARRLPAGNPNDELGHLASNLNEMLASLERAYTVQERFAADASHELRTPLASIQGNLELLKRTPGMPESERAEVLQQVRNELDRLTRLVRHLLSLARADSGQALNLGLVELDALAVEAHRQTMATANGVTLRIQGIEPVAVTADPDRVKELLLILLENAVRYSEPGGLVSLAVGRDGPWAKLVVADNGIGIAREDLPHIFDRFWRADSARSRDRGGTGLGLAIARAIVDAHGGEILVDSTPGRGTTFTVHLPLQI